MTVKEVKDGDAIFNEFASMDDSRHSFTTSVVSRSNNKGRRKRRTSHASNQGTLSHTPYTGFHSSGSSFGTTNTTSGSLRRERYVLDNTSAFSDEPENDTYETLFDSSVPSKVGQSEKLPPLPPPRANPLGSIFARSRSNSSSPEVDLYSKISSLQTELQQYNDLQKTYEILESDFLRVKMELAEYKAKNDTSESKVLTLRHELASLKEAAQAKDEKIKELESESRKMRIKLDSLEDWRLKRIDEMKKEMDILVNLEHERSHESPSSTNSRKKSVGDIEKNLSFFGLSEKYGSFEHEKESAHGSESGYYHKINDVIAAFARNHMKDDLVDSTSSSSVKSLQGIKNLNFSFRNRFNKNRTQSFKKKFDQQSNEFFVGDEQLHVSHENLSEGSDSQSSSTLGKMAFEVRQRIPSTLEVKSSNKPNSPTETNKQPLASAIKQGDEKKTDVTFLHGDEGNDSHSLGSASPTHSEVQHTTNSVSSKSHDKSGTVETTTDKFQFPNPYKEDVSTTDMNYEENSPHDSEDELDVDWGERQLERRRLQKEQEEQQLEEQKQNAMQKPNTFGFGLADRFPRMRRVSEIHKNEPDNKTSQKPQRSKVNRHRHPPPSSILGPRRSRRMRDDLGMGLSGRSDNSSGSTSNKRGGLWG